MTFEVSPDFGIAVTLWVAASVLAAVVLAAKGRPGWCAVGIVTGGVLLIPAAFLVPAAPRSLWARI